MKIGRRTVFHGAFTSKKRAIRKERRVKGGFIQRVRIKGHPRYLVRSRKRG